MKKRVHSKIVDLTSNKISSKCSGYILNYPSLESPIFINQNVWEAEDEKKFITKTNQTSFLNENKISNKSANIYDMLNYSSGCCMNSRVRNGYEAGFYRPLTSPNQIKLTSKKKSDSSTEPTIDELKIYLTEALDICNKDEFTKKQTELKKNRNKHETVFLKTIENTSIDFKEPKKGILKKSSHVQSKSPVELKIDKKAEETLEVEKLTKPVRGKINIKSSTGKKMVKTKKKAKVYPSMTSVVSLPKLQLKTTEFVTLPEVPLYNSKKKKKL